MRFKLRQMEMFRAIMITGSISGASRMLFVSQPVVSRSLSHLEKTLGITLFERRTGALVPTEDARIIYREIEEVYSSALRVDSLITKLHNRKKSRISFCCSPSLGASLIPLSIRNFMNRSQETTFDYKISSIKEMPIELLSRNCDLALSIWPINHPNLSCEPLFEGEMVLLVPNGHPLTDKETIQIQDLHGQRMITYHHNISLGEFTQNLLHNAGVEVHSVVQIDSSEQARGLVQNGIGIALIHQFGAGLSTLKGMVAKPVDFGLPAAVYLITSKFEVLSKDSKDFVHCILETFQRDSVSDMPHPIKNPS